MSAKRILPAAILLLAVLSPCLLSQEEAPEAVVAEETITTDPAALDALKKAESKIYSPLKEGLKTLSFDQKLSFPNVGDLGTISYWYEVPSKMEMKVNVDESNPMAGQIKSSVEQQKLMSMQENLGLQLGKPFSLLLQMCHVTYDEEGQTNRIRLTPKAKSQFAKTVDKMIITIAAEGQFKGLGVSAKISLLQGVSVVQKISYKKFKETPLFILEKLEMEMDTPFGAQTVVKEVTYTEVEKMTLVKNVKTKAMGQEFDAPFVNFKINQKIDPSIFEKEEEKPEETK